MSTIKVDNIDSKDSTGNITISRPLVATLTAGSINNLNNLLTPANASVTAAKMATTDTLPAWNGSALTNLPVQTPPDNSVGLNQLAGGTDGNLITFDTAGDPAYVATGTVGQVLTSAGANAVPSFAAPAGGGKIGQVLQARKTDTQSSSSASTIDITGLSVSITASATTSRFLVTGNIHMAASTGDAVLILFRDSTEKGGGDATGSSTLLGISGVGIHRNLYEIGGDSFCYRDPVAPADTSTPIVYKLAWRTHSTVAHYVNRTNSEGSGTAIERVASDITVWEILA